MRYLFSTCINTNINSRQEYLWDSLRLWTIATSFAKDFVQLESIPSKALDTLFLIGHNINVADFLQKNFKEIHETNIVLVTCKSLLYLPPKLKDKKRVYLSRQQPNNTTRLLAGKQYGFDFDLTESEILFYNNRHLGDISARLDAAFTRI